jgi:hypothetical protein
MAQHIQQSIVQHSTAKSSVVPDIFLAVAKSHISSWSSGLQDPVKISLPRGQTGSIGVRGIVVGVEVREGAGACSKIGD